MLCRYIVDYFFTSCSAGNKSGDDLSKADDKPSSKFELRTLRQSARNSPR